MLTPSDCRSRLQAAVASVIKPSGDDAATTSSSTADLSTSNAPAVAASSSSLRFCYLLLVSVSMRVLYGLKAMFC
jgi:hypothetical protein